MENAIAKPYLRVISFSKLSISLKHDQVNKKEKASIILTELKTEFGEICIFPLENRVTLFHHLSYFVPKLTLWFRSLSISLFPLNFVIIPCFIPAFLCSPLSGCLLTLKSVNGRKCNSFPYIKSMFQRTFWI